MEQIVQNKGFRKIRFNRSIFSIIVFSGMTFPSLGVVAADKPLIGILTGSQTGYKTTVSAIQANLTEAQVQVVELPKVLEKNDPQSQVSSLQKAKLIITVGTQATSLARQYLKDKPLLFCMIPNVLDQACASVAGLTTDISPADQIRWVQSVDPALKTLGILYSPRTAKTFASLQTAAKDRLTVVGVQANKEEFMSAVKDLSDQGAEGVLMLPDVSIYNAANVRGLLVWAIRQKKPVFTFSDNLVKGGALAGQYTEPEDLGLQVVEMVREFLKGQSLEKLGLTYPKQIKTAVNERTAELINLNLDETLLNNITKRHGKD